MPPKVRGAVKVNPVTGKLEKVEAKDDGLKRDGCMRLPDKYLTAALDAGLGGRNGMYGHIGTLNKVRASGGGTSLASRAPALRGDGPESDGPRPKPNIRQVVQGSSRKVSSTAAASSARVGDDVHFNKRKGVINTLGGAKDTTRAPKSKAASSSGDPSMRPSGRLRSSGVHTISSFSKPAAAAVRAPRGGSASSRPAGGIHTFSDLEHSSKVGLRKGDGSGGGAGAAVSSAATSKMGDLGSVRVSAPSKQPRGKAAKSPGTAVKSGGRVGAGAAAPAGAAPARGGGSTGVARGPPIVRKLGGRSSVADSGKSDREKRLAFFDKKFG